MAECLERSKATVESGGTDRIQQQVDALAARHLEGGGNEIALVSVDNSVGAELQWPALLSCRADRADDRCPGVDRKLCETEPHTAADRMDQHGPARPDAA